MGPSSQQQATNIIQYHIYIYGQTSLSPNTKQVQMSNCCGKFMAAQNCFVAQRAHTEPT